MPKVAAHFRMRGELENLQTLLSSPESEIREMAEHEFRELTDKVSILEKEIEEMLILNDPEDAKDVIIEIRAGTGGDEAALFAGDLFRAYTHYAENHGFKVEIHSAHSTGLGGFKEVIFEIIGPNAFHHFKFERGVHRVQRVPHTEANGRIHTSTATVAVMPEVDEIQIHIDPKDLRIDTYRSSGAGGQHVNKTESAVRITHIPTGIVAACQEDRSQIKNRQKAMNHLRAALYQAQLDKVTNERVELRRAQVGTGDRSEKIRTYNYPQDRVTDHRVNQNFHNLPGIMEGGMNDIIQSLWDYERSLKLEQHRRQLSSR